MQMNDIRLALTAAGISHTVNKSTDLQVEDHAVMLPGGFHITLEQSGTVYLGRKLRNDCLQYWPSSNSMQPVIADYQSAKGGK